MKLSIQKELVMEACRNGMPGSDLSGRDIVLNVKNYLCNFNGNCSANLWTKTKFINAPKMLFASNSNYHRRIIS